MSERQMRRSRARQAEREGKHQGRLGHKVALTTGAALGVTALFAPAAGAATFTVTSLSDVDEQAGTLREEIEDANEAEGDDTILFETGLSGTITLVNNELNVYNESLAIQGPRRSADRLR